MAMNFACDRWGQLLSVADMKGNVAEQYVYAPAGNILSKTIDGKTTTYTYDKANQLVTSVIDGKTTNYAYDAAGRLVKEGEKSYTYGWLDKILNVQEQGKMSVVFDYHVDGQIASATHGDKSESFLWDGLALIHRGETSFINEPYVTGGNPILSSKDGVMFNDMLGNTLGNTLDTKSADKFNPVAMTAFGETADQSAFFTGKPYIGELGYAFLFRNYRADQGKWQTTDPLGYPDGWNQLAYCNNGVIGAIDYLGAWKIVVTGSSDPSYSIVIGSTTKKPNGDIVYIDHITVTASQNAVGSGTDTLVITSSGTFSYRDTNSNTNKSISISFTTTYTVDNNGVLHMAVTGNTTKTTGDVSISGTSGSDLSITGCYSITNNGTITNKIATANTEIKFKVEE